MRQRVLFFAAEMGLRARVGRGLLSFGYAVELAGDQKRALELASDNNFQVGIVVLGSSPANSTMLLAIRDHVPQIIVLAERPDEIAWLHRTFPEINSLLLTKSNEAAVIGRIGEIIAGIDKIGRKAALFPTILCIDDCKLDLAGHVFIAANGREVPLTRAEAELLKELARHPRQVLSRDDLRRAVKGRDADSYDRSIDMLVARLRRKIEPDPKFPRFLITVSGAGYKLV